MLMPRKKRCSKCGELKPCTSEYFHRAKKEKWGYKTRCKECGKKYYNENKENILEKRKKYYNDNKEEVLEKCKKYREEHKEEINKKKKQHYNEHKEEILEKQKQYHVEHKEERNEYYKQWYENNKEEVLEKCKKYREEHKEEIKEYFKQYNKENPHIRFNAHNKRRQREENQGNGISKEQWYEMMEFFNWECAYSGEYLGGNSKNRTIDHVIPLDKNGEHEIWNCVPMYANYNYSKNASDMLEWYQKQDFYSEERLNKIYEWIEYAYNKWGNK